MDFESSGYHLGIALASGLLLGAERERHKGEGPTRGFAGIRTFALVPLSRHAARVRRRSNAAALSTSAILAGLTTNTLVKDFVANTQGGPAFAARMGGGLAGVVIAAGTALVIQRALDA